MLGPLHASHFHQNLNRQLDGAEISLRGQIFREMLPDGSDKNEFAKICNSLSPRGAKLVTVMSNWSAFEREIFLALRCI